MKKNIIILLFVIFSFNGCSLWNKPSYYMSIDIDNKKHFSTTNQSIELYRCETTINDICLLFDKNGDFIKETISPKRCFIIKKNRYCPIPSLFHEQIINDTMSKDMKIKQTLLRENAKIEEEDAEVNEKKLTFAQRMRKKYLHKKEED